MGRGKPFFLLSLVLLVVLCALGLAAPYGKKAEVTAAEPGVQAILVGHSQIAVFVLPLLLSLAAALGGLGGIQSRAVLPETVRASAAWAFATGIVLHGLAHYWVATNKVVDFDVRYDDARWMGFAGTVLLLYALLAQLGGHVRGARAAGGQNMKSNRVYAMGGLLVLLWMTLRISQWVWPWLPVKSDSLTSFSAAMFTYPLTVALGAAALMLSPLQACVRLPERVKLAAAYLYLGGTAVFFLAMYEDLRRDRPFDGPFSGPTSVGLAVIALVLLLNLAGLLRHKENLVEASPVAN